MKRLALSLARDESTADDVVQETWLKLVERSPSAPEPNRGWIRKVLQNFVYQMHRAERRRLARERLAARPDVLPQTPDRIIEEVELQRQVAGFVLQLDEPFRSTVLLRFFQGLTPKEIAREHGVPEATVRSRLARALDKLRLQLDLAHGGSRKAWLAVLLPTLALEGKVASAAEVGAATVATPAAAASPWPEFLLGGLLMTNKAIVFAACAIALTGMIAVWIHWASRPPAADRLATSRSMAESRRGRSGGAALENVPHAASSPKAEAAAADPAAGAAEGVPSIQGRIMTQEGKGIAGARVLALDVGEWDPVLDQAGARLLGFRDVGVSVELRRLMEEYSRQAEKTPRATSGTDGSYVFRGLREGEHRLLAVHEDFLPSAEPLVLVIDGRTARRDIRLAEADSISGRIVDEEGMPLEGARIAAKPSRERILGGEDRKLLLFENLREGKLLVGKKEASSGPDGTFRLGSLEPTLYDVAIRREGLAEKDLLDVPAGTADLEVILPKGLSLRGRVLFPDRRPAGGIPVILQAVEREGKRLPHVGFSPPAVLPDPIDIREPSTIRTDLQGLFAFSGLSPGLLEVRVEEDRHAPLRREVSLASDPIDLGDLVLETVRSIEGRVVDARGSPIAGARIWIDEPRRIGIGEWGTRRYVATALVEGRSGPGGEFSLGGLGEGFLTLRASARDHVGAIESGIPSGSMGIELVLRDGWSLRGTVVDGRDGHPVPEAEIVLLEGGEPDPEKTAAADSRGKFEIRGLPFDSREPRLRVSHPDYPAIVHKVEDTYAGKARIELFSLDRITGKVLDREGNPVPGARVRPEVPSVKPQYLSSEFGMIPAASRSKEDGSFIVEVPRALRAHQDYRIELQLIASHDELGTGRSPLLAAPAGGEPWPEVEIVLALGSVLAGKVLDVEGNPVPRSMVFATRLPQKGESWRSPETAISDAGGAYRFPRIEPGRYRVEARAQGFSPRRIDEIEVGEEPRTEDIVLEAGWCAAGRVIDGQGHPVEDAEVVALETEPVDRGLDERGRTIRQIRRDGAEGILSTRTGPSGRYELANLPDRPWTLVARAWGFDPSELLIVEPGQKPEDLVLTRLSVLAGTVSDAGSGRPIPDFLVHLKRKTSENWLRSAGGEEQILPRWFDDPGGRFVLDGLVPGLQMVAVKAKGYGLWWQEVPIGPGEERRVQVRLEPGKTLRGTASDIETGRPVPGAFVVAFEGHPLAFVPGIQEWTDEEGNFSLSGLLPGRCEIRVHHLEFMTDRESIRVTIGDQDPEPLEVGLRAGGRLDGALENFTRGKTIFPAVVLKRIGEPQTPEVRCYLESDGRFRSRTITPGSYSVSLREMVPDPSIDMTKGGTLIKPEDMTERVLDLGSVEILRGETTKFEAKLSQGSGL